MIGKLNLGLMAYIFFGSILSYPLVHADDEILLSNAQEAFSCSDYNVYPGDGTKKDKLEKIARLNPKAFLVPMPFSQTNALQNAADYGNIEAIETIERALPGSIAAMNGKVHFSVVHYNNPQIVRRVGILHPAGFSSGNGKFTPAHSAALHGYGDILNIIAEIHPESLNTKDARGYTPIDYAKKLPDVVDHLKPQYDGSAQMTVEYLGFCLSFKAEYDAAIPFQDHQGKKLGTVLVKRTASGFSVHFRAEKDTFKDDQALPTYTIRMEYDSASSIESGTFRREFSSNPGGSGGVFDAYGRVRYISRTTSNPDGFIFELSTSDNLMGANMNFQSTPQALSSTIIQRLEDAALAVRSK